LYYWFCFSEPLEACLKTLATFVGDPIDVLVDELAIRNALSTTSFVSLLVTCPHHELQTHHLSWC